MNDSGRGHVDEAIETIAELERQAEAASTLHQRWIERVTASLGKPRTVFMIVAFVVLWIGINLILTGSGRQPFDPPPFAWLQGLITFAALLMAALILITATRAAQIDVQRDAAHPADHAPQRASRRQADLDADRNAQRRSALAG